MVVLYCMIRGSAKTSLALAWEMPVISLCAAHGIWADKACEHMLFRVFDFLSADMWYVVCGGGLHGYIQVHGKNRHGAGVDCVSFLTFGR